MKSIVLTVFLLLPFWCAAVDTDKRSEAEKKKGDASQDLEQALEDAAEEEHDLRKIGVVYLTAQIETPIVGIELEFLRLRYQYFQLAAGSIRVGMTIDERLYYGISTLWLGAKYSFGEGNDMEVGFLTSVMPILSGTNYYLAEERTGSSGSFTREYSTMARGAWFYTKIYFRYYWRTVCVETGLEFPLLWYEKEGSMIQGAPTTSSPEETRRVKELIAPFNVDYGDGTRDNFIYYHGFVPPIFLYLGVGF